MNILLPIKPWFAEAILKGTKGVEFRKVRFRHRIRRAVIYATVPQRKVVGLFEIRWMEYGSPTVLWEKHGRGGAISQEEFFDYYSGTEQACALGIGSVVAFANAFYPPQLLKNFVIPRQFRYLTEAEVEAILRIAKAD